MDSPGLMSFFLGFALISCFSIGWDSASDPTEIIIRIFNLKKISFTGSWNLLFWSSEKIVG